MPISINPIFLPGAWDEGYALDQHIITSIPIGEDPYGYMRFESVRSEIGELMYQFKYNNKYECVHEIVTSMYSFLQSHPQMLRVDTIIPVPPTKRRYSYQPTHEIATLLAKEMNVFCSSGILEKTSSLELKSMSFEDKNKLDKVIIQKKRATRKHSVLLIDDLYKSGTTLTQCVLALREDPNIDKIFVLVATKTKNN